jgi:hypothetical protein
MVHMTSSRRLHEDEAEDGRVDVTGCIRVFYPNFVVFFVLDHKGNLVISFFSINRTPRTDREVINSTILLPPLAIVAF